MNSTTLRLIVLHLLLGQLFFAQEQEVKIPDSLKSKGYLELGYWYHEYLEADKKEISLLYAKTYIAKAKKEKNDIKIAEGFYYLGYISESELALSCMDSIIAITENLEHNEYPSAAYLFKGIDYGKKRAFKEALDNFIHANTYARKNYNPKLIYESNYAIAVLKNRIGDHKEALEIYRECYDYLKQDNNRNTNNERYLYTIFSMVTAFYRSQELDSALHYNNLGIKESLRTKDIGMYNYFVLSSGVISHLQAK